jgi:predicted CXXCH cytochrome family protein
MCHQSHASYLPRLIRREPMARLCSSCHARADLLADTAEHRPEPGEAAFPPLPLEGDEDPDKGPSVVADCTRCHDPHRGSDRLLLRERYVREHELRAGDPSPQPALP